MLEKFQHTFQSPDRSLDLLKSLNSKQSDLYLLSEEKSPPPRLPSLPLTSEGLSAKMDEVMSCNSEIPSERVHRTDNPVTLSKCGSGMLTVETDTFDDEQAYKLHSPPPVSMV